MDELTLAEQMEAAALAASNETMEDCGCGDSHEECACDDKLIPIAQGTEIAPEASNLKNNDWVIQLPSIPGTTANGTSAAEADAQKTKRLIYTFGGVLAALILLTVVLAVTNSKNPAK